MTDPQLELLPPAASRPEPINVVTCQPASTLAPPADVNLTPAAVAQMLQSVINGGVTEQNVSALDRLLGLAERMQDRMAAQEYARAFAAAQQDMPRIAATKVVPNRDGSVRYRYAPLEEIMAAAGPTLQRHGFSVSFPGVRYAENRVVVSCVLRHTGGHTETTEYAVRVGQGPPAANESQADGAAVSYAKRGALCSALGIVIEHPDSDARDMGTGKPISGAKAAELAKRLSACGGDERAFLRWAGAETFAEIPEFNLSCIEDGLRRKEASAKAGQP